MAKELEIEFKNMLTATEYQELINLYSDKNATHIVQTNYYFDTPNQELKQKKMGLRIREKSLPNELTLKVPTTDQHALVEVTDHLTEQEKNDFLNKMIFPTNSHVREVLLENGIQIDTIKRIGELSTDRLESTQHLPHLIVIDKSTFYGHIDYELEMETNDSSTGEVFFKNFLKENHIPERPADKKIARMLFYKGKK